MKSISQIIKEELNNRQKKTVDNWVSGKKYQSPTHKKVHKYIEKEGGACIRNYNKGITDHGADDADGGGIKHYLRKVPELQHKYLNDPTRKPDYKAPITTKPTAAEKISAHVMPHDRVVIPLENHEQEHVEPHPDIKNHLESNGYKISNYVAGTATDKYNREVKIGKALKATKAPDHLLDTFNADPKRTNNKNNNLQVVISRHPYDVAGMSTDRGWTSCMNMKDGSNKQYLKHDITHGTHVAYLTQHGDNEVKNPIARIALKPFTSKPNYNLMNHALNTFDHGDDTESHDSYQKRLDAHVKDVTEPHAHTILRPEEREYGTATPSFSHTVRKWTEHNFPMKDEHDEYHKNKKVYDDAGYSTLKNYNKYLKTPELTDKMSNAEKWRMISQISNHPDRDKVYDHMINNPKTEVNTLSDIARFGSDKHRGKLINHPSKYVKRVIMRHGNEEHQKHLATHEKNWDVIKVGSYSDYFDVKHIIAHRIVNDDHTDSKNQYNKRLAALSLMENDLHADHFAHILKNSKKPEIKHIANKYLKNNVD